MTTVRQRKINSTFTLILVGAVVLYLAVGFYLSGLILATPPRRTVQRSHEALREGWGYDQDSLLRLLPRPAEVSFPSATAGLTLRGWWFEGRDSAACGFVMAHGITENRANMIKYAAMFRECGCDMLLFDHRGHGASDGEQLTGSFYESEDVLQAKRFLARHSEVDPFRIGLVGESWGAAAVLVAAAKTDSIAFVLADSPFSSWRDAIVQRSDRDYGKWLRTFLPGAFLWVRLRSGARPRDASPVAFAKDIVVPALLVHGKTDTITPYAHAERIAAAMDPDIGRAEIVDWGAWHAHNALARPGEYRAIVEEYFAGREAWFCGEATQPPETANPLVTQD